MYSNTILTVASKSITDELQRLLNAAARICHVCSMPSCTGWTFLRMYSASMSAVQNSCVPDGVLHTDF